jgi:hyperosmotically inducible protein
MIMRTQYSVGLSAFAVIASALVLTACIERDDSGNADPTSTSVVAAVSSPTETGHNLAAALRTIELAVDDSALTAKVKAALLTDPGLLSIPILVGTRNAVVTLSGTVDSDSTRDHARRVANGVEGVSTVVDRMSIHS